MVKDHSKIMKQSKFTYKKQAEREANRQVDEAKKLDKIVENIMAKTREDWLEDALFGFPPLHGEVLEQMSKEELIEHIRLYDICLRTGKPMNKKVCPCRDCIRNNTPQKRVLLTI